ncbi:MAG TPA: TauD/TfdA family dioxygenase [Myxococcota bacterium]|nr:TauD/TfdA family dioxygenase [Myxococcota bacterium]
MSHAIEVLPVAGRIGAEVRGVDLSQDPPEGQIELVREALLRWKVLFFREQRLDAAAQQRFARRFGPLTGAHPTVPGLREHPDVLDVDARNGNVAVQWHTDVTFVDRPPLGSILRAVVLPALGGDTLWANTAAAYEDLSAELQTLAGSLQALHTNQFDYVAAGPGGPSESLRAYGRVFESVRYQTLHPVVRVHPETGERVLFLGGFARSIAGVSAGDSKALLSLFHKHVTRPENTVRWRWRPGDVAFWDNRATQHRAIADFGREPRQLQRVTIAGELPVGIDGRTSKSLAGDSSAYNRDAA